MGRQRGAAARVGFVRLWGQHRAWATAALVVALLGSVMAALPALRARHALAAPVSVVVPGTANIYGAGHATPPAPAGGGGGTLPPSSPVPAGTNQALTFSSVTGGVYCNPGSPTNGPDGGPYCGGNTAITSYGGISGISDSQASLFLVGAFVNDSEPQDPAPPVLDFSAGQLGTAFLTLAPELNQTFFIGDGLAGTGSGTVQQFLVPSGATRLFLGFADGCNNLHGPPGCYDDNGGQLSATFQITSSPSTPPVVTGVSPNHGSIAGGLPVTVTGSNFASNAMVSFGGMPAESTTVESSTQLVAVTPSVPGPGLVDITVTNPPSAPSATSPADRFAFDSGIEQASDGPQTLWLQSCDESGCLSYNFEVTSSLGVDWSVTGLGTSSPYVSLNQDSVGTSVSGARAYNIVGAEAEADLPTVLHYESSTLVTTLAVTSGVCNGPPGDAFVCGSTPQGGDTHQYAFPGTYQVNTSLLAAGSSDWYGYLVDHYGVSWSFVPAAAATAGRLSMNAPTLRMAATTSSSSAAAVFNLDQAATSCDTDYEGDSHAARDADASGSVDTCTGVHTPNGQVSFADLCSAGATALCNVPSVAVSITGAVIPNIVIAQKLLSIAEATGTSPNNPSTVKAAVATAVLDEMLFDEAVRAGQEATLSAAAAAAKQELAAFEQHPDPNILPAGETPTQFFLSPQTVAAYRIQLTIGTERRVILGNLDPQSDHTPALAQWMQSVLPGYMVSVSGVSVSNLPGALPPHL